MSASQWRSFLSLGQPPRFCSFCRKPESASAPVRKVTRCNRCQLKQYCSLECDSQDHGSHRSFCLHIERMRKHYETYPSHPLGVMSHQMGNLLFCVAYRTMDTFEHEAHIFQEALQYFHEAYVKYVESGRHVHNLEDQILVIFAALGHDMLAFREIYLGLATPLLSSSSLSSESSAKEITPHECTDLLTLLPDAPWRISHLTVLLLLKMRLLHRLKMRQNLFNVFQTTHAGLYLEQVHSVVHSILMGSTDAILEQERQIYSIYRQLPAELMQAICHARPMIHTHAPRLFHVLVPTECWQILQDCFRTIPDVEKMMNELAIARQAVVIVNEGN